MSCLPCLSGVSSARVKTSRLETHLYRSGERSSTPILLLHGNFSSGFWFQDLMTRLPGRDCIAPDLRGYGETEALPIDARRGAKDWSEDLGSLIDRLELEKVHLLGWSAGAAAAMQLMLDRPDSVRSLTLLAPVSPYGFGGTKDRTGTPVYSDYAGSGGGIVSADFVHALVSNDMSMDSLFSPRNVFRQSYVTPPFVFANEDQLLSSALMQTFGDRSYPGDSQTSGNWPGVAPGIWGPLNALSPKYFDSSGIVHVERKAPVLWVQGGQDRIVSDRSMSDLAVLGELGYIPGWPGSDHFPAQPMVEQTRCVLDSYQRHGGTYEEFIIEGAGHTPHIEQPQIFSQKLDAFLKTVDAS